MSIKSLIKNIRYDKNASSFSPIGGYGSTISRMFQSAGYDANARTFRMGSGGKITPKSTDRHVAKTHQAVDQAVSQGDVLLIDTSKFEIKKDIKNSVINIYNPKKVILESSSQDFTSESEKREMELEARRKSTNLKLLGGGSVSSALRREDEKSSSSTSTEEQVSSGVVQGLLKWLGIGGGSTVTAVGANRLLRRPPTPTPPPTPIPTPARPPITTPASNAPFRNASRVMFYEAEAARLTAANPLRATTLEQAMFEYGARRGLGQGPLRAGVGTVISTGAEKIAASRLALGALKGGAMVLSLVPDILAIYAQIQAEGLTDQLIQQQENLKYPYGKGKQGLLEVRQAYAGQPKMVYHNDAINLLQKIRPDFEKYLDAYEASVFSQYLSQAAPTPGGGMAPGSIESSKKMAARARKEMEGVYVNLLPPWLLMKNPEEELIGNADNMFEPKSMIDLLRLHTNAISNSPDDPNDLLIPSYDSESTLNLENSIRRSLSGGSTEMSLLDKQDPSQATSEWTFMGGLENISSAFYNAAASGGDLINSLFFEEDRLPQLREDLKTRQQRDMSIIDDRPSTPPTQSGDTTIIQIDGGGGGGTQIPEKVSSRSDENRMLQNLAMGIPIQERNVLLA